MKQKNISEYLLDKAIQGRLSDRQITFTPLDSLPETAQVQLEFIGSPGRDKVSRLTLFKARETHLSPARWFITFTYSEQVFKDCPDMCFIYEIRKLCTQYLVYWWFGRKCYIDYYKRARHYHFNKTSDYYINVVGVLYNLLGLPPNQIDYMWRAKHKIEIN